MSILIKDTEMPQGCGDCPCLGGEYHGSYDNHFYCQVTDKGIGEHKPDWCPLIEVPEDVQPVKWIPVEEKLPEKKGNYLVVFDCGHGAEVHEAFFFKYFDSWEWYDPVEEYQKYDVTHWMPLPEPPIEAESYSERELQRDYEKSVEIAEYCERYEPTYNPETGTM